jgi:hypothetical protein
MAGMVDERWHSKERKRLRGRRSRTNPRTCQVFNTSCLDLPQIAHIEDVEIPGNRRQRLRGGTREALTNPLASVGIPAIWRAGSDQPYPERRLPAVPRRFEANSAD